jgi:hypothetical protein
MTITLDVPDAVAKRIQARPDADRQRFAVIALSVGAALTERPLTPLEALALPADVRGRILQAQAEAMAPYYEADLALPPHERELTAFTALDGVDPIHEDYPT